MLEALLLDGTRSLDDQMLDRIERDLGDTEHHGLCASLRGIRDGSERPEELIRLFETHRRQALAHLSPPMLDPLIQGKRLEGALREINLAAGASLQSVRREGHVLEQLAAMPSFGTTDPIMGLDDVPVLWCLVRAGRIAERRAAVRRLGTLISDGALAGDTFDGKELVAGLVAIRDPRIAFEVDTALVSATGSAGRAARQRLARADRLLARVGHLSQKYWAGKEEIDPLDNLSREELLRLGVWIRRGPDELAGHVAEYLQSRLVRGEPSRVADAVGAFIPSGDERLVPVLSRILPDGEIAERIATARALARIADPRVHRALIKAYRHATDVNEKTVIGGALGQFGDDHALDFLLGELGTDDPALLEEVVRSLGSIGSLEAEPRLVPLLQNERSALVRAVARALVRCGGPAALAELRNLASRRHHQATMLHEASEALALKLQLLGRIAHEETGPPRRVAVFPYRDDDAPSPPVEVAGPPWSARFRSLGYYLLGLLLISVWQHARALRAFTIAAQLHRGAPTPLLREAQLHAANSRDDLAIRAFRRALTANRRWVLRRQRWVEQMLHSYMRRADNLVARKRKREALDLLDEVASLDLRAADLDVRLAVTRRRDRLLSDRPQTSKAK
jgi:tetratricopeptide (TPR) repeat protein